ncbi:TetR/AcrR family transcriptional regulator [Actinomadura opuntiae]|uniref:TetR/AcrR family transcriptional regulator n=1 Tax=Actinomadura sp. OS1-43 TaxID=604315 RepID=UPI00255ABDB4|nr:TetR/AcrR family transcriptional regulator [Actinomadura sp. OS1-43]MDL4817062.1 TetR family transcriptional regulator [Actinomadura sp. OS1-43]
MTDTGPAAEDLTARARIRDAALEMFAERGTKGATFRGIAEAAGVSVGLVQHHFGSKQELREACDAYALDTIRRLSAEKIDGIGDPGFLAKAMRIDLPVRRYLARALVDGSPAAARVFDDLVDTTERYFTEPLPAGVNAPVTTDVHAYSAALVAMTIGTEVLHEHLSRVLGVDTFTPEGALRLRRAFFDIFDDRLLSRELAARARAAIQEYESGAFGTAARTGNTEEGPGEKAG